MNVFLLFVCLFVFLCVCVCVRALGSMVYCCYGIAYISHVTFFYRSSSPLLVTIYSDYDVYSCRVDKTAWLGETEDRKLGFFKSEYVEELLGYDIMDGTYECIYLFIYSFILL